MMIIGSLGAGGKEQQLISLLKGLAERGNYSVVLVVLNAKGLRESEASQFVDHFYVVKRILPYRILYPLFQILSLARKHGVSLIHTWGSGVWDFLGLCVSLWLKIPLLHGGIRSAPSTLNFPNRMSKMAAKGADAVVANSKAGLKAFGQVSNPKATVIYNGLDLSRFEGIEPAQIQYDLCMVANFSIHKDHQTAIKSMALISKENPQTKLLLVGHDAGTLASTMALVNQLGLDDSVTFVSDCLKPYQLIAQSKIGVLASYEEGVSNAILEYFVFSKPVIATNNEGNAEIIEQGLNGFLVDKRSPEDLAEKVLSLLRNPGLAAQLGARGREIVLEKFDVEKMIASFESVYSGLITGLERSKWQ